MRRKNRYTEFGLWIKIKLIERNMTQEELGKHVGLKRTVVYDVMIGRNNKQENKEKIYEFLQKEA